MNFFEFHLLISNIIGMELIAAVIANYLKTSL